MKQILSGFSEEILPIQHNEYFSMKYITSRFHSMVEAAEISIAQILLSFTLEGEVSAAIDIFPEGI